MAQPPQVTLLMFIYNILQIIGLRTDPCRIQLETHTLSDNSQFTITFRDVAVSHFFFKFMLTYAIFLPFYIVNQNVGQYQLKCLAKVQVYPINTISLSPKLDTFGVFL